MFRSIHKKNLIIFSIALLILGVAYIAFTYTKKPLPKQISTPQTGNISIRGQILCLPHKNTNGPQTMECAYGLKDLEGRYYGLQDSDPTYKNISSVPTNTSVEVTGIFTPKDDTKYQSIGVILVSKISPVIVPERITVSGTYLCLPYKDTTGPQTDECALGIMTDDKIYYALDFGLSSQTIPDLKSNDTIRLSGVLIPIEQLSTNHWQKYPIIGIISVTDSVEKL